MFGPGAFIAPPWSFTQLPNAALGMLSAFDFLALIVTLLFSYGNLGGPFRLPFLWPVQT